METATIKRTISDLKEMGVFWIGLTGGEPLLNKNIAEIVESIGDDCAAKLFTTGCTLTKQKALDLKNAGLFSVSISLDHWREAEHDRIRNYPGAFKTAMNAIDIFRTIGGVHVGVSAVLSKEMMKQPLVEEYLDFLQNLGIHEAWLSETKPSVAVYSKKDLVITQEERLMLLHLQDRYNKVSRMTMNYLGHFEDAQHFGCTAGHKMVYVDAFGEVSPCVFIPMTFGNVQEQPVREIYREMRGLFPTEDACFINKNYEIIQKSMNSSVPLGRENSKNVMDKIKFGPFAKYFQLQYR